MYHSQTQNTYIFFTPTNYSSADIASGIFTLSERKNTGDEDIAAIGCNDAVLNAREKVETISIIERKSQRPVPCIKCLLYIN